MLHWAKSFAVMAVLASFAGLWLYPGPLGVVAVFLTAVFVTLAILSLITGALGKRRDGWSYFGDTGAGDGCSLRGASLGGWVGSQWSIVSGATDH